MFKINTLFAFSFLGLVACGGGSSGFVAPKVLDGVFKDSNVSGLSYVSGSRKGVTDAKGKFKYEENKEVSFSVGNVALGSAQGLAIMTPLDLVADGNLASDKVINRTRFLMMLDLDNKPGNGINISKKVQAKAKNWEAVDFAADDFLSEISSISAEASAEDGVAHVLPTAAAAKKHLKTTLLCSYAGAYVGAYSGTEEGHVALMVDPATGEVIGSSYDSATQESTEIKAVTAINYDVGLAFVSAQDSAKKFSGQLSSTDKLSGSWVDVNDAANKGDFNGARVGGASNAVYRYTVAFKGDDKGLGATAVAVSRLRKKRRASGDERD